MKNQWKKNYFLKLWIIIPKILWCSYHHTQPQVAFLLTDKRTKENRNFSLFVCKETEKGEKLLRARKKEKRPWAQAAVSKFLFGHQAKPPGQSLKCYCYERCVMDPCGFLCFYRTASQTQKWYLGCISFFERSLSMNNLWLANYCLVHFWKHAICQGHSQMLTRLRSV